MINVCVAKWFKTLHINIIIKYKIIIICKFYYKKNYVGLLLTGEGMSCCCLVAKLCLTRTFMILIQLFAYSSFIFFHWSLNLLWR